MVIWGMVFIMFCQHYMYTYHIIYICITILIVTIIDDTCLVVMTMIMIIVRYMYIVSLLYGHIVYLLYSYIVSLSYIYYNTSMHSP